MLSRDFVVYLQWELMEKNMDNPFVFNGYAGAEYFCDRYKEPDKLLSEAQAIFPNTLIAADGGTYEVHYPTAE